MEKIKAKAILFDKDGTLLEFAPFWQAVSKFAVNDIAKRVGGNKEVAISALKAIGIDGDSFDVDGILCKGTYGQIAKAMYPIFNDGAGVNLSEKDFENLCLNAFHDNLQNGEILPTSKNLKKALKILKQKGKKLFVVTSDDEHTTSICLKGLQIDNLFEKVFVDDGIHPHKPNPYYANLVMQEYGFSKDELVMVGDTLTDADFAKNSGIKCIGIVKTLQGNTLLDGKVTKIVQDIATISDIIE